MQTDFSYQIKSLGTQVTNDHALICHIGKQKYMRSIENVQV